VSLAALFVRSLYRLSEGILKVTQDRICKTENLLDELILKVCKETLVPVRKIAC
jgi:hypothetical protein